MTSTSAQQAIAVLLDLAQQGEIDPWDVQVIDVIDRFLSELGIGNPLDEIYPQTHLPQSGQAFLWASMLVRYKADTLESQETAIDESDEIVEDITLNEDGEPIFRFRSLENHLRRRSAAPPLRKRRVTLQELITQIEEISQEIGNKVPKARKKRPKSHSRQEALQTITELAHQENLTELAEELTQFLQMELSQEPLNRWIDFEHLLTRWHQRQPSPNDSQRRDRVGVFWALLLLCSQSRVALSQSEFYQDLSIEILESPQ